MADRQNPDCGLYHVPGQDFCTNNWGSCIEIPSGRFCSHGRSIYPQFAVINFEKWTGDATTVYSLRILWHHGLVVISTGYNSVRRQHAAFRFCRQRALPSSIPRGGK